MGPDITRSLQHRQAQVAKSQKQNALLASLNALPDSSPPHSSPTSPSGKPRLQRSQTLPLSPNAPSSPSPLRGRGGGAVDKVDPLAEPYPTLPLWRRVDRQFWWNEWLSKPFIDAGVCLSVINYINRGSPTPILITHLPPAPLLRPPNNARPLPNIHLPHTARTRPERKWRLRPGRLHSHKPTE